ncbi:hypothetical protein Zmor_019135 [Zophobas morio]|uniref:Protein SMG7 n=1 Tax=Zophobas morio TaxID=2755281 RepID=A0AA38HJ68_9CUCU|nr:hypothetical protein Zmor_019135 [Zophobas morio]
MYASSPQSTLTNSVSARGWGVELKKTEVQDNNSSNYVYLKSNRNRKVVKTWRLQNGSDECSINLLSSVLTTKNGSYCKKHDSNSLNALHASNNNIAIAGGSTKGSVSTDIPSGDAVVPSTVTSSSLENELILNQLQVHLHDVASTPSNTLEYPLLLLAEAEDLASQQVAYFQESRYPVDPEMRTLRSRLISTLSKIIFLDFDFAVENDVDKKLWKLCFHKSIEEYRKTIREISLSIESLRKSEVMSSDPTCLTTASKALVLQNKILELSRLCRCFRGLLNEAVGFYTYLAERLARCFDLHFSSLVSFDSVGFSECPTYEQPTAASRYPALLSVHRCLIYLGDLARYFEVSCEVTSKDFIISRDYYLQALGLLSINGLPHNQLAVLNTYSEDYCGAVYRYCRSLLVAEPFETAKWNLQKVFEGFKTGKASCIERHRNYKKAPALQEFLQAFLELHSRFFHGESSIESLRVPMKQLLTKLLVAIKKKAICSSTMFQLVIINISLFYGYGKDTVPTVIETYSLRRDFATEFIFNFMATVLTSTSKFVQTAAQLESSNDSDPPDNRVPYRRRMPKQKNRGDHPPFMSSLKVFFDWLRWSCDAWWPPHERSRQLLNRRLLPSLASMIHFLPLAFKLPKDLLLSVTVFWRQPSPLPEDIELQGFSPLSTAVSKYVMDGKPTEEPLHIRVQCFVAFAQWAIQKFDCRDLFLGPGRLSSAVSPIFFESFGEKLYGNLNVGVTLADSRKDCLSAASAFKTSEAELDGSKQSYVEADDDDGADLLHAASAYVAPPHLLEHHDPVTNETVSPPSLSAIYSSPVLPFNEKDFPHIPSACTKSEDDDLVHLCQTAALPNTYEPGLSPKSAQEIPSSALNVNYFKAFSFSPGGCTTSERRNDYSLFGLVEPISPSCVNESPFLPPYLAPLSQWRPRCDWHTPLPTTEVKDFAAIHREGSNAGDTCESGDTGSRLLTSSKLLGSVLKSSSSEYASFTASTSRSYLLL